MMKGYVALVCGHLLGMRHRIGSSRNGVMSVLPEPNKCTYAWSWYGYWLGYLVQNPNRNYSGEGPDMLFQYNIKNECVYQI